MSQLVRRSIETLAARPLDPQEVRLRPAPLWSQVLVGAIIGTASAGFVFAVLAQIDEVVVAPGTLQPLGEPLLRLDPDVSAKRSSTVAQQRQLERQREIEQSRAFAARADSLRAKQEALRQAMLTEQRILKQIEPLAAVGAMQQVQVLQQRNRVQQLRSEIAQTEANLREVQAELVRQRQESLRNLADLTGSGWRSKRPRTRNCCGRRLMGWCLTWFPPAAVMRRVRTRRCSSWCPAAAWKPRCFSPIAKWDL